MAKPSQETSWREFRTEADETEPERIKTVVNPMDYKKVELPSGKSFFMSKSMTGDEKKEYVGLLEEYLDVFAWVPSDLSGIPPELGEHWIDLVEGVVPVRQR